MIKGTDFDDVSTIIGYMTHQIEKLPIVVKRNFEADREFILENKPDVVVLAIGGSYALPENIPGIQGSNVAGVADLAHSAELSLRLLGPSLVGKLSNIALPGVGKNVVILGGQIEGLQGALFLRKRGRNVTVLEESDTFGARMPPRYLKRTLPWLAKNGVETVSGVRYDEITKDGVRITTGSGQQRFLPADTILILMPPEANDLLRGAIAGDVSEVHRIGCGNGVESSLIIHALTEGREIGCQI